MSAVRRKSDAKRKTLPQSMRSVRGYTGSYVSVGEYKNMVNVRRFTIILKKG